MAIHTQDMKSTNSGDVLDVRPSLGTTGVSQVIEGQTQGKLVTKDSQLLVNDGTYNRVAIGQRSDGTYGVKVSKPNYDALTAADSNLYMSSDFNNLKVYQTGTVTLTTSGTSPRTASQTITHNLGYSPVVTGSVLLPAYASSEVVSFPFIYTVHDGSVFRNRIVLEYFAADLNSLYLQVAEDFGAGDFIVRYYILVESGR